MSAKKWSKNQFSASERKAYVEEKVKELNAILEEGVQSFSYSPEDFKAILEMKAIMPSYSFRNIMVAKSQLNIASYIAPMSQWKKLGRYARKGERALRIFKPRIAKEKTVEVIDGKTIEIEKDQLIGFITVPVFDISQTDGKPMPIERINYDLQGASSEAERIIDLVHEVADCPITYCDTGSANGLYYVIQHKIEISDTLSVDQRAKTLVHEYVHSQVHRIDLGRSSAEEREIVAEGVAFVVCSYFGLDTSRYSFYYVKSWQNQEGALLKYGNQISDVSKTIIQTFEAIERKADESTTA